MEEKNNCKDRKEKKMKIQDYLIEELKRLNRQNDLLEKQINQGKAAKNEFELIIKNTLAMCEIAKALQ